MNDTVINAALRYEWDPSIWWISHKKALLESATNSGIKKEDKAYNYLSKGLDSFDNQLTDIQRDRAVTSQVALKALRAHRGIKTIEKL